jgi:Sulfotransferase domain
MSPFRVGSRRPTFLILGAPKCGTTALAQALAAHPDVFLSRPKEPHFFDCGFDKGLEGYLRDHFRGWRSERASGEATPSYLALPWVPRRILATLPDARLIVILRHPVERAYSSWWMFHARAMDKLPFDEALRENERQLAERTLRDDEASIRAWADHIRAIGRGQALRIRTYLDSGHYAAHLQRYFELFPRERVRVVFSDELRQDSAGVVRSLWRFLGVDADVPGADVATVNEAIAPSSLPLLRLVQATGVMRFRALLPESLKAVVKQRLAARGTQPPLEKATRMRLLEYYEPYTRELERLLGVDLSPWKE